MQNADIQHLIVITKPCHCPCTVNLKAFIIPVCFNLLILERFTWPRNITTHLHLHRHHPQPHPLIPLNLLLSAAPCPSVVYLSLHRVIPRDLLAPFRCLSVSPPTFRAAIATILLDSEGRRAVETDRYRVN
jgi:hypothetical protein